MTVQPGRYRHFKGKEYEVLFCAKNSETLEETVIYRALYGERGIWARPASMWNEIVERDGKTYRRFTKIEPQEDLAQCRSEIDEIDRQMAQLFCRRMKAVQKIGQYKKEHGMQVLDAGREQEVLDKNTRRLTDAQLAEYYSEWMKQTMAISRAFQQEMLAGENKTEN